jgi:hypothetical protein
MDWCSVYLTPQGLPKYKGAMADKKQFSNTKSIMKVETGIVTLISYHHYLKIVGNNKLWPDMQKESW